MTSPSHTAHLAAASARRAADIQTVLGDRRPELAMALLTQEVVLLADLVYDLSLELQRLKEEPK